MGRRGEGEFIPPPGNPGSATNSDWLYEDEEQGEVAVKLEYNKINCSYLKK